MVMKVVSMATALLFDVDIGVLKQLALVELTNLKSRIETVKERREARLRLKGDAVSWG
jgi:hypothetical protein